MVSHKCLIIYLYNLLKTLLILAVTQNDLGDPHCGMHDKMPFFFTKFKEIQWRGFRATLFKVALISSVLPVKMPDLGLYKLDLLRVVILVEVVGNCSSSMDENLIIMHRVQHARLRNEGFLCELGWNFAQSSY